MAEHVLIERPAERVAHVILNRPERRNALTGPLAIELLDAIRTVDEDPDIGVMVLRGAGGAFCSGLDLKEFNLEPKPDWVPEFGSLWREVHRSIFDMQTIVVGALERAAVNGGAALAIACDFLVAGESAFLQVGEIQQGMAAPMNMAWLRLRYSEALAARVALLGDRLTGPQLVGLGMAFESVPDDEVVAAADRLAGRLAEHDPTGVIRIKKSLRRTGYDGTAEEWFAGALAADPLRTASVAPRAAENR